MPARDRFTANMDTDSMTQYHWCFYLLLLPLPLPHFERQKPSCTGRRATAFRHNPFNVAYKVSLPLCPTTLPSPSPPISPTWMKMGRTSAEEKKMRQRAKATNARRSCRPFTLHQQQRQRINSGRGGRGDRQKEVDERTGMRGNQDRKCSIRRDTTMGQCGGEVGGWQCQICHVKAP